MQTETSELSFVLKPAKYGIGVFASHSIKKGTSLRLFQKKSRMLKSEQIPPLYKHYCVATKNNLYYCPQDFGQMEIGWYLNHSRTPNAYFTDEINSFASKDIAEGEEILIDYNDLEVPEDKKDHFY